MAGNNKLNDEKSFYDWFTYWKPMVPEQKSFKGYDLSKGVQSSAAKSLAASATTPVDMLKLVRLSMPSVIGNISGQDALIKKVIDNPDIELTEEGLRKIGFSDNDIDLFMKDDRFQEAVQAREDKKFKEEWVDEHLNTGLSKEFPMEPPSNQIYHTKLVKWSDLLMGKFWRSTISNWAN